MRIILLIFLILFGFLLFQTEFDFIPSSDAAKNRKVKTTPTPTPTPSPIPTPHPNQISWTENWSDLNPINWSSGQSSSCRSVANNILAIGCGVLQSNLYWDHTQPIIVKGKVSGAGADSSSPYWCGLALLVDDNQTYGSLGIGHNVAPTGAGNNIIGMVNEWDTVLGFGVDREEGVWHDFIINWQPANTWRLTANVFNKRNEWVNITQSVNRTVSGRLHVGIYTGVFDPPARCQFGSITITGVPIQ